MKVLTSVVLASALMTAPAMAADEDMTAQLAEAMLSQTSAALDELQVSVQRQLKLEAEALMAELEASLSLEQEPAQDAEK
ncbi:hypothetical protein [Gallaecimonas sp. GXIMD4217]|uniref:hypothetical protein n=1 Tax=Gallaecimonas sp. GXIMD4217 TaxID=3131927 RepID=UPI00311B2036